jgi:hypothetical protein
MRRTPLSWKGWHLSPRAQTAVGIVAGVIAGVLAYAGTPTMILALVVGVTAYATARILEARGPGDRDR